ncbi:MAG: DEAD/DEAH box helicase family protein [Ruminococcaceae bacterium]|nr:DEAD/DEAH box helicase family protein [Oscillospiraceae bacterium]
MSEKITFKFEELGYQTNAVNAVVDLLQGIDRGTVNSIYSNTRATRTFDSTHPEANARFSVGSRLIANMQKVQYRNGLFKDNEIVGRIPQFTIEMETGTGKTFVYLKTILSLWATYHEQFKKFIIVVPSNPILLGVKKSVEMLSDYFKPQFQNIDLSKHTFVYDKNCEVGAVTSRFIENTDLSIMLVTYQSFNKDTNRLRTPNENGVVVWEDIKDVAPIVIIDEPQKIDGTGRKKSKALEAIEELNPPMILRYSATHKNLYNPIYKLDSFQAYQEKLVKQIKVTTIHSLMSKEKPYIRFIKITPDLKALIEIFYSDQGKETKFKKFEVENNAPLEELSGGLPQYKNWFIAEQPNKQKPLAISCGDGNMMYLNAGTSNDDQSPEVSAEMQMRIAIKAHITKQIEILNEGGKIKALALFFVDSVSKVRGDAPDGRGEYLVMFDRVFDEIREEMMTNLLVLDAFKKFPKELAILDKKIPASAVREGYFAVDKNKKAVEIEKWNSDVSDEDVSFDAKTQENIDRGVDLILNKKDELISFGEPLTFIFSHSALREGWDNPNVFTLVTLKHGSNDIAKKQEVGRGLRLPVNTNGVRCKLDNINQLTVVANDYYDQFAASLQEDYNNSMGFNKNEVSADIVKNTMKKAGIPEAKIETACDAFKREIIAAGIVKPDKNGKLILTSEADERLRNITFVDPVLIEHSATVVNSFVDLMTNKGTKKITVINGDEPASENGFQKYFQEETFYSLYRNMLEILQMRSVYRYNFDKDKFIADVSAELERLFAKKNDKLKFEITNAYVDFNEAQRMQMSGVTSSIEEDEFRENVYAERPLFDIVNFIMQQTMLPRLAIIKIINNLKDTSKNKLNDQDHLEDAVDLINKKLTEYKRDFIEAQLVSGVSANEKQIFEVDQIIDEENIKYFFKPNPAHHRALNLKYKFDSDGEEKFAKALDEDTSVLMWTKLKKGGFVIETPVGDYSPDWAIVYQKSGESISMYFIAETKCDEEWNDLTEDEQIKIRCAAMHFKAVDKASSKSVKYKWVNAYNDTTKNNSFPQIFVDENYENSIAIDRTSG